VKKGILHSWIGSGNVYSGIVNWPPKIGAAACVAKLLSETASEGKGLLAGTLTCFGIALTHFPAND
jgi:hypothetical protein